jgi:hypothetical protein
VISPVSFPIGWSPPREVDDREALHCEADAAFDEVSRAVRAAMREGLVHPQQQLAVDRPPVEREPTADAAHAGHCRRPGAQIAQLPARFGR